MCNTNRQVSAMFSNSLASDMSVWTELLESCGRPPMAFMFEWLNLSASLVTPTENHSRLSCSCPSDLSCPMS